MLPWQEHKLMEYVLVLAACATLVLAVTMWTRVARSRMELEKGTPGEEEMVPLTKISTAQQRTIVSDLVTAAAAAHDAYAPDELWRSNTVLMARLDERLRGFGARRFAVEHDGNCQFRALAFSLYGSTAPHARVRAAATEYMASHTERFACLFETEAAWAAYLRRLRADCTWGDELSLRAVAEAYRCVIHVVTSEKKNFYLSYAPEDASKDSAAPPVDGAGRAPAPPGTDLFLSYLLPVHYDAVAVLE